MNHARSFVLAATALALGAMTSSGFAQTIERVRLIDNELNCTQIYAEVQQMDTLVQLAGTMTPVPVPTAAPAAVAPPVQLSAIQQAVLNHSSVASSSH